MKMKTNIRTFSSKKLVLGIVTTVIGISTIALVSENAYASTSTVKSQIVKNTTKPTTTVKTVKPVAVKNTTTKVATNVTIKKSKATVKPIVQKAPTTTKKPSTTTKAPTTTTSPTTKPNASSTGNATRKQDYYKSMTELYNDTTEGIDWKKDTRNVGKSVLIVAPHGGNLEQGTSELTKLVANNGDFDYFSFEAIRPSNNTQLHVTSTNYDDATLHDMIQDRTATISIHGARGEEQLVYLGGYQSSLRDAIQSQLELKGFIVKIPPKYLGGLSNNNFINKVEESTGVQLELTTALRKAFFKNEDTSTVSRKK